MEFSDDSRTLAGVQFEAALSTKNVVLTSKRGIGAEGSFHGTYLNIIRLRDLRSVEIRTQTSHPVESFCVMSGGTRYIY